MSGSQLLTTIALTCVIFCTLSGFAHAQQPVPKMKEPEVPFKTLEYEWLSNDHKLDPSIANAIKPDPNDSPLRKLQKERCRERAYYIATINNLIAIGKWNPQDFLEIDQTQTSLFENLQELIEKPTDKLKCYELLLELLKTGEKFTETRVEVSSNPSQNLYIARAIRIDAEIDLLKFRNTIDKEAAQQPAPDIKNSVFLLEIDPFIASAIKPDPNDSPLRKLQKGRCRERAYYVATINNLIAIGKWSPQDFPGFLKVSASLSENLLELMDKSTDKLKCYELRVEITKRGEKFVEARVEVGSDPTQNLNLARTARIDADIELLKFRNTIDKPAAQQPASDIKINDSDEMFLRERGLDPFIANAIKPDPNDSPLRKLQKVRCRELAIYLSKINTLIEIGKWNPQDFLEYLKVSASLFENLLELMDKPTDKLKCYELRVEITKRGEKFTDTRVQVGSDPSQNLNTARAIRIDAEIDLLKFKTEIDKPKLVTQNTMPPEPLPMGTPYIYQFGNPYWYQPLSSYPTPNYASSSPYPSVYRGYYPATTYGWNPSAGWTYPAATLNPSTGWSYPATYPMPGRIFLGGR